MTSDKVDFYLSHRSQISEWAKLEMRANDLMRDAVEKGALDSATNLLKGESGDDEADFYVRNRSLITEWDALQTLAGEALHRALVGSARKAVLDPREGGRGWTSVFARSPELDRLHEEHKIGVEMAWTKQDLLSTRRKYPFPRLALTLHPERWNGERRDMVIQATRPVAHQLGMRRKLEWWVHWGMLDAISESQDLESYADACVTRLRDASVLLYPVVVDAISANPVQP
ncbi:hypothetical protein GCM10027039_41930 [Terrabacter koreensis]